MSDRDKSPERLTYDWIIVTILGEQIDDCQILALPKEKQFSGLVECLQDVAENNNNFLGVMEDKEPSKTLMKILGRLGYEEATEEEEKIWSDNLFTWYKYDPTTYKGESIHFVFSNFM